MNKISITYSKNLLPFIQIKHNGLMVNRSYAPSVSNEFLRAVLYSEGYDNVPESLIEDIKAYYIPADQEEDVTVVFTYT